MVARAPRRARHLRGDGERRLGHGAELRDHPVGEVEILVRRDDRPALSGVGVEDDRIALGGPHVLEREADLRRDRLHHLGLPLLEAALHRLLHDLQFRLLGAEGRVARRAQLLGHRGSGLLEFLHLATEGLVELAGRVGESLVLLLERGLGVDAAGGRLEHGLRTDVGDLPPGRHLRREGSGHQRQDGGEHDT
jgi:hypothetical protein